MGKDEICFVGFFFDVERWYFFFCIGIIDFVLWFYSFECEMIWGEIFWVLCDYVFIDIEVKIVFGKIYVMIFIIMKFCRGVIVVIFDIDNGWIKMNIIVW